VKYLSPSPINNDEPSSMVSCTSRCVRSNAFKVAIRVRAPTRLLYVYSGDLVCACTEEYE
jgi:hypothetical protein